MGAAETAVAPSDGELVARVRAGDNLAFEELYCRYQRRISRFVRKVLRDDARAEDVTQKSIRLRPAADARRTPKSSSSPGSSRSPAMRRSTSGAARAGPRRSRSTRRSCWAPATAPVSSAPALRRHRCFKGALRPPARGDGRAVTDPPQGPRHARARGPLVPRDRRPVAALAAGRGERTLPRPPAPRARVPRDRGGPALPGGGARDRANRRRNAVGHRPTAALAARPPLRDVQAQGPADGRGATPRPQGSRARRGASAAAGVSAARPPGVARERVLGVGCRCCRVVDHAEHAPRHRRGGARGGGCDCRRDRRRRGSGVGDMDSFHADRSPGGRDARAAAGTGHVRVPEVQRRVRRRTDRPAVRRRERSVVRTRQESASSEPRSRQSGPSIG
jgi:hypothetical protein